MPSGIATYIRYKREAGAYASHDVSADATWKVFGHGLRATPTLKRNLVKIQGVGNRQPTAIIREKFEPAVDLDFQLSNPWWLRLLMGNIAIKTGVGPYSYYWLDTANENGGGAVNPSNSIPAFTIENGIALSVNSVRLYQGAFVSKASISAAVGGTVDVRLTCPFGTISKGSAGLASQAIDAESPFSFITGSLKMPTGAVLASVQNVTLEIDNGLIMPYGIGSEVATAGLVTGLNTALKASMLFVQDSDVIDVLLGSSTVLSTPTVTTLDLLFDNGLAGVNQRQISFKFTGVQIDDDTLAQAVENPLIEEFTPVAQALTLVKSINNTATEP